MDTATVIIVIVALLIIAAAAWFAYRAWRRSQLKDTFGREYDRTVDRTDSRREAEADLQERRRRRDELEIRPLSQGQRERYLALWDDVEARFIEDPDGVARDADRLVQDVMRERGYPLEGRDHIDVLSVEHPDLVERYRAAMRTAGDPRSASTEDLRQALLDLRATFDELVRGGTTDVPDGEEAQHGSR